METGGRLCPEAQGSVKKAWQKAAEAWLHSKDCAKTQCQSHCVSRVRKGPRL